MYSSSYSIFKSLVFVIVSILLVAGCGDDDKAASPDLQWSWVPLGSGVDSLRSVNALTVYKGKLIAGGSFENAGGKLVNRIAAWNGSSWSALGSGMNGGVDALTVYDNKLIAGGSFTTAGGVPANRIAAWDGSAWSALGSGMNNYVWALAVYDDQLFAGGQFTQAGGVSANHIAAWNGSTWSPLAGGGTDKQVHSLAVWSSGSDSALIAGGWFRFAGGQDVRCVAAWMRTQWVPLGSGMTVVNYYSLGVYAISDYFDSLVAGGDFQMADGNTVNNIAKSGPYGWLPVGSGTDGPVLALTVFDGKLTAGGEFLLAGGVGINHVGVWSDSSWKPLDVGIDGTVYALGVYNNQLIAGGRFTTAGGKKALSIAAWGLH